MSDDVVESNGGWVFSPSEEGWFFFNGFDSPEDAMVHAPIELDLKLGDTYYLGLAARVDYVDLVDSISGDTLVENLQETAYEKWGWEDAFEDVSSEQSQELETMIRKAYTDWVKKHDLVPGYFHIEHTQKCVVPPAAGVESPIGGSNAQDVPNEVRELQRPVLRVLGCDEDPDAGAG